MPSTTSLPKTSTSLPYTCTCAAQTSGGSVLLFYRYFANDPVLPPSHTPLTQDPNSLASFHRTLATSLSLTGKFRLASEGFNITLGGTTPAIKEYIKACTSHWSFAGLPLSTPEAQDAFFKPTPGCACAFPGGASIRVTAEITPLGITDYAPASWGNVISLPPAAFHALCEEGDVPLLDVRNHYESRIGYFVSKGNAPAIRPAVRRFSQWPAYVERHVLGKEMFKQPGAWRRIVRGD
ncbi:hypothetical protein GRF29_185g1428573 [Pseudopithomyces chartarum]|uniref:tRNA uridine(34) hydroxylase N-terminal domain-containing protein n=1 Tax=Pseudopithomyces chartarum TaxID=1892770 RepID=A0AAN6LNQ5_9PLEO|nr:hypothetical protein GRF29_185g1428573 [Pseudopithomyces chartarum]